MSLSIIATNEYSESLSLAASRAIQIIILLYTQGIPIIYYGTEQGYHGGNDPNNRETLWPNYNTNSDLYKFIGTLSRFRTKMGSGLYKSKQIERYVDDQLYAFTRGNVSRGQLIVLSTCNLFGKVFNASFAELSIS